MKTKFYFLIISLISLQCCTQQQKDINKVLISKDEIEEVTFSYINEKERINWSKFGADVSISEKKKVIDKLKKQFDYIFKNEYYSGLPFERTIHFLDLNGDKRLDVIVEGYSGAESENTQFFLAQNSDYKKVLEKFQYVKSFQIHGGQLKSLTILDFGCCAEYVKYETKYQITPSFSAIPVYQKAKVTFEQKPKNKILNKPLNVATLENITFLRSSPVINDTSTVIYDAVGSGNVLAKYPKGSIGYAWVTETDSKGVKWWYVEMLPVKAVKESLLYEKDDIPTRGMGWISEDQLEIKNN